MNKESSHTQKHRKSNFTQTSNTIINDGKLTLKAKGLFLYLWSKPDGWTYYTKDIMNHCKDKKDGILSGIRELESHGYLMRVVKFENGLKRGYIYHLADEPDYLMEDMAKGDDTTDSSTVEENPPSLNGGGKSSSAVEENPPHSNTNSNNTKSVADETSAKTPLEGDIEGSKLAKQLVSNILTFKPDFQVGDKAEKWAKDFALAIRRDGRTYTQMTNILHWMVSGGKSSEFWKTVVLSGGKFRDQIDQLEINMKKDGYVAGNGGVTKDILKDYLVKTFGKSKSFMEFTVKGKKTMVAFTGEYYTMANYNTGAMLSKEQSEWVWNYMLSNHSKMFPGFKG